MFPLTPLAKEVTVYPAGKGPDVVKARRESQETGAHFSCRNKDIGWHAQKHVCYPSLDQPGALVPS